MMYVMLSYHFDTDTDTAVAKSVLSFSANKSQCNHNHEHSMMMTIKPVFPRNLDGFLLSFRIHRVDKKTKQVKERKRMSGRERKRKNEVESHFMVI